MHALQSYASCYHVKAQDCGRSVAHLDGWCSVSSDAQVLNALSKVPNGFM